MNETRKRDPYRLLAVFFALAAGAAAVAWAVLYRDIEQANARAVEAAVRERTLMRDLERARLLRATDGAAAAPESSPTATAAAVLAPKTPGESLAAAELAKLEPERFLLALRTALSGPITTANEAAERAGRLDALRPFAERLTADPAVAANAYLLLAGLPGVTAARIVDLYTRSPIDSKTVARAASEALAAAADDEPASGVKELERLTESGLPAVRRLAVGALATFRGDPRAAGERLWSLRDDPDAEIADLARSALRRPPIVTEMAPRWSELLAETMPDRPIDPLVVSGMIAVAPATLVQTLAERLLSADKGVAEAAFATIVNDVQKGAVAPDSEIARRLLLPLREARGKKAEALLETYRRFAAADAGTTPTAAAAWASFVADATRVFRGQFDAVMIEADVRGEAKSIAAIEATDDPDDDPPAEWRSFVHLAHLSAIIARFSRTPEPPGGTESAPTSHPATDVQDERIAAYLAWVGYEPAVKRIAADLGGDRRRQLRALVRLMRSGFPSVEAYAESVLDPGDPALVRAWLSIAARRGATISSSAVRRILLMPDTREGRAAAELLAETIETSKDAHARSTVVELVLSGQTPFVAETIGVCALGGEPRLWPVIKERMTSGDARLREAALRAADRFDLGGKARELVPFAKDESPLCRAVLARLLSEIDDPNATSTLYVLSHDSSAIVREAAVLAIARNPGERGAAVLKDGMDDPDRETKNAAMRSLAGLGDFDRIEDLAGDADDVLLGPRTRRFLESRFQRPVGRIDDWIKWWREQGRPTEHP